MQSKFLKDRKNNLTETEIIVLADFAENYSFVMQDETQGHHWLNRQATVHPFVFYFKYEDKINSHSICIINEHLKHDTSIFYTFQKHLIQYITENHPKIKKIIYFSDGAASQYKNKKTL